MLYGDCESDCGGVCRLRCGCVLTILDARHRASDNELPEVAIYIPAPSAPQALRAGVTQMELRGLELSEKQSLQSPR